MGFNLHQRSEEMQNNFSVGWQMFDIPNKNNYLLFTGWNQSTELASSSEPAAADLNSTVLKRDQIMLSISV